MESLALPRFVQIWLFDSNHAFFSRLPKNWASVSPEHIFLVWNHWNVTRSLVPIALLLCFILLLISISRQSLMIALKSAYVDELRKTNVAMCQVHFNLENGFCGLGECVWYACMHVCWWHWRATSFFFPSFIFFYSQFLLRTPTIFKVYEVTRIEIKLVQWICWWRKKLQVGIVLVRLYIFWMGMNDFFTTFPEIRPNSIRTQRTENN